MSRSRSCGCVECACIWCVMSGQGAKRLYPCISATAQEVVRFLAGRGRLWVGQGGGERRSVTRMCLLARAGVGCGRSAW
jgi:hypothetical protein